jgi:MoxR-like ATPase
MTPEVSARLFRDTYEAIRSEVEKVFVGQRSVVDGTLSALLCDGHVLLEGVPGLGKTLLVHTLGQVIGGSFSRIQFTPDLMPADITGSMVLVETEAGSHEVRYQQGPIVANLVLADEVNRATPKTQSAMLEAMQERQVSAGRTTVALPKPFIVLATQNPIEHEGTYPLPEAQLDRFLVKLQVSYPTEADYHRILEQTTGLEASAVREVCEPKDIVALQRIVRSVEVGQTVRAFAIRMLMGTQPHTPHATERIRRDVALGASPRGAQALLLTAKVQALLDGRFAISCEDIRSVAKPVLRHRILLSFDALAEGRTTEDVIDDVLEATRELAE